MKIRTSVELLSAIDDDLSWRKKELRYLASRISGSESDSQLSYIRASIALLYAHWEGFVVTALRAYLNFVNHQRILFEELRPELRVAILKVEIRRVEREAGNTARAALMRAYEEAIGRSHKFTPESIITGDSNLNSSRFLGLLAVAGLDESAFAAASMFLDASLLEKRNDVCHGERLSIDVTGYLSTEAQVIDLIEQLKVAIMNAAALSAYKV